MPLRMAEALWLTSPAFQSGGAIPEKYTCEGNRTVNPPLSIQGVSADVQSLALIVDDPDVPKVLKPDGVFDHWVLFNIAPETKEIAEGQSVGIKGANSSGQNHYTGPCPPKEYMPNEHRYFFRLYALDTMLALKEGASKAEVLKAMEGHIVQHAELMGTYRKQN